MASESYTLRELADMVGGRVVGNGDTPIHGVAGIKEAKPGDITFFANPAYEPYLRTTRASAVIGPEEIECGKPMIRLENPYLAFLKVLTLYAGNIAERYPRGIHETAIVDPSARMGKHLCIGPYTYVGRGASIGDGTTVVYGAYIGDDVAVGENCLFYPHVTIREGCEVGSRVILHPGAVIGADGFGFAKDGASHQKIPQVGRVVIEDDVEIGANTTVDRATTGITRVCEGSKLDNLIQIGHNVVVGKNSVIAAQTGIAGSTEVGEDVMMGGQTGVIDHLRVGNRVTIAAQTGVLRSVPDDTTVSGYPAREHSLARRIYASVTKLPELFKRLQRLEARMSKLESESDGDKAAKDNR